ncbi:unnamed protein product [Brucella canis str. Oliveri]|nr:unnamed protein product [Brucella canis str. Oliveri]
MIEQCRLACPEKAGQNRNGKPLLHGAAPLKSVVMVVEIEGKCREAACEGQAASPLPADGPAPLQPLPVACHGKGARAPDLFRQAVFQRIGQIADELRIKIRAVLQFCAKRIKNTCPGFRSVNHRLHQFRLKLRL